MVVFYSKSGNTARWAQALANVKGDGLFELKPQRRGDGFLSGVFKSIFGMETRTERLPDLTGEECVYVCSPVWAGRVTPAVRHFINNSQLKGKTVKLLLTCKSPSEGYIKNCGKIFSALNIPVTSSLMLREGAPDEEKLRDF